MKVKVKAAERLSLQGGGKLDALFEATTMYCRQHQYNIQVIAESIREEDGIALSVAWDWNWDGFFNQYAIRIQDVEQTPFYYPDAPNQDNGALRTLSWWDDAANLGWETWRITSLHIV